MSQEHSRTNGTWFGWVITSNLEKFRERVLRREEPFLNKTKLILSRWMKRLSRWTVAISRPLMNRRLPLMAVRSLMNGRMRFHLVKKVRLRFLSSIGFWSCDRDLIGDPPLRLIWTVITLDQTARMISLKWIWRKCLIRDPVDIDSTWSTRAIDRTSHPTLHSSPRRPEIK